jgi:hypothetical protein
LQFWSDPFSALERAPGPIQIAASMQTSIGLVNCDGWEGIKGTSIYLQYQPGVPYLCMDTCAIFMATVPVMGPGSVIDSYNPNRPPSFGSSRDSDYSSYRRDVEFSLELAEIPKKKQGVVLFGCLVGEAKEFARTLSNDLLFSEDSGKTFLKHLARPIYTR